ncbi:beta-hydroxyacyl-ACP dehydratase [Pseudoalteromonas sp. A25]|uniref:hotdog fold thioesterase n=1 Tax=Pseudoalteromonas sp. A25 TaxID=116092 RepID=UPI0012606A9D|nr:beta-ketoacyl synthase N-terminal-like domain-containing protein [Pseudoalteromonas sp. A25]BBN80658.1 beta-hydroxyacyl-ACP dehydratase [Pseudoalteromonas sp. A25]
MKDKIAIVGLGCVFPEADNPEQLWKVFEQGTDVTSEICEQELGVSPSLYKHPEKGTIDKIGYSKNGYVRKSDLELNGFRVAQQTLQQFDKVFQWTLHAAAAALKDAGSSDVEELLSRTGLVLGNINMPTHAAKQLVSGMYHEILTPHIQTLIGREDFAFSKYWQGHDWSFDNLLIGSHNAVVTAQALGLQGPTYTIDGACSSGIYSISLACKHLQAGEADIMLAGATCQADHIYINHGFNVLKAFPDRGEESLPFDKRSGGLKAGEGVGVLALKRYSDAKASGDKIYGVIDAIGLSNDAGAKHMLVPDSKGQQLALSRAYEQASRYPDYVECHATGTPVGDKVELNSIASFFGAERLPKIGANKQNFGHALTASSMISIFKVLLAMQHDKVPATQKVEDFVGSESGILTINSVVRSAIKWPAQGKGKVAGVNAFGFGGVNGHLVICSEDAIKTVTEEVPEKSPSSLAIVGLSACLPKVKELVELDALIEQSADNFSELPLKRWSGIEQCKSLLEKYNLNEIPTGAFLDNFIFDCQRYKIPPNVAGLHLLSHLSLMPLAEAAFLDAGFERDGQVRNIAVIVAGDDDVNSLRYQARTEMAWQLKDSLAKANIELTDEELKRLETITKDALFPEPTVEGVTGGIGNIVSSRISALLKLNGPAFTLQSHENSIAKAIDVARLLLDAGQVDAVIVGGGSFGGSAEGVMFAHQRSPINSAEPGKPLLESKGWKLGEGGGVVVLKPSDTVTDKDRVYATIEALSFVQSVDNGTTFVPDSASIAKAANMALTKAGVDVEQIGLLEVHASGIDAEDEAEKQGLLSVYGDVRKPVTVSNIKQHVGHLHGASYITSLIGTALNLYRRRLPAVPQLSQQQSISVQQQGLVLRHENHISDELCYAAISGMGLDRTYSHMVLKAADKYEEKGLTSLFANLSDEKPKGLFKTIWVAGENTIAETLVNDRTMAQFAPCRERFAPLESSVVEAPKNDVQSSVAAQTVSAPAIPVAHNDEQLTQPVPVVEAVHESAQESTQQGTQEGTQEVPQVHNVAGSTSLPSTAQHKVLSQLAQNAKTHSAFLQAMRASYAATATLLASDLDAQQPEDIVPTANSTSRAKSVLLDPRYGRLAPEVKNIPVSPRSNGAMFNEQQLHEITDGLIANVLGPDYAAADQYPVRTRMPSWPYMFVSRILSCSAERGQLKPCEVHWEYDISPDDWYVVKGQVPSFVSLESSHAMIVAFTLIGCDEMFQGQHSYRAVNSETTVYGEFPKPGEILRGVVRITSFKKMGNNVLIDYEYDCFAKAPNGTERHCFTLVAASGFFYREDLQKQSGKSMNNKGVFFTAKPQHNPIDVTKLSQQQSFDSTQIAALNSGLLSQCFGDGYADNSALALYGPCHRMLDRVSQFEPCGGAWQLGQMLGEVDISTDHWVFNAHFKNDPCVPGTFTVEGCQQLFSFYMYYLKLPQLPGVKLVTKSGHASSAKFRGEVKYQDETLFYRMTIKDISVTELSASQARLEITAVIEVLYEERVIGLCDDMYVCYEGDLQSILTMRAQTV